VGMGGEGIVLKDPASIYRPGGRSPAWLKLKPKLALACSVTSATALRVGSLRSDQLISASCPFGVGGPNN
jgi:ATP-dependent DNA ligase